MRGETPTALDRELLAVRAGVGAASGSISMGHTFSTLIINQVHVYQ